MSVYVDRLFNTKRSKKWPYTQACHLIADSVSELHEFADRLGLKRSWFQKESSHPHYDLTRNMRNKAVKLGAIELEGLELAKKMRSIRITVNK